MKKLAISAMALFMSVAFANAQGNRPEQDTQQARPANEARPAQGVNEARPDSDRMAQQPADREYYDVFRRDLRVDDDQIGRIRTLHTETINRYNSIEPQYLRDDAAYKVRVNELLRERDERLRSILTPEQFQRYDANRDNFRLYDTRYFNSDLNQRRAAPATNPSEVKPVDTQYSTPRPNVQPAQPAETVPVDARPQPTSPTETRPVPPAEPASPNER